jgi:excisionase family DNA binding protein
VTGKELIIYILTHGLENEPVVKDGRFIGFLTMGQFAEQMNVGMGTVSAWIIQGRIDYVRIGGYIYIPADSQLKEVEE